MLLVMDTGAMPKTVEQQHIEHRREDTGVWSRIARQILKSPRPESDKRHFEEVVRSTYATFARKYPVWAAELFDEQFTLRGATPILKDVANGEPATADALSKAWTDQMWYRDEAMRQRLIEHLSPAARAFLALFKVELRLRERDAGMVIRGS